MWFKNLYIYRFTKPFELTPEEISEQLTEFEFQPCESQELSRTGWVPPLGRHGSDLVHANSGNIMLCAKRQDKLLPASVVAEEVEQQIEMIEQAEARSVGRKEKQSLKEEMIFTLMPKAFVRSSLQYAYIAPREGWLVINCASAKKAEDFLNALRDALGTLPVIPLQAKNIPLQAMTNWLLSSEAPNGFEFGHQCELRDPSDEGGTIRCKHQDLTSTEMNNHLKAGMTVSKLGLIWSAGIDCVIDENLAVKSLGFDDVIQEQADSSDGQDVAEKFDNDFSIMALELSRFIKGLVSAFGGEDTTEIDEHNFEAKPATTSL
jgi:recombination associated protein RdgC